MEYFVSGSIETVAGTHSERSTSSRRKSAKVIARASVALDSPREHRDDDEEFAEIIDSESAHVMDHLKLRSPRSEGVENDERVAVVRRPMKPMQGNRVRQIAAAPGFSLSFNFRLASIPTETANILHCVITGMKDTHLPSVSIRGGSSQLILTMQLGTKHVKLLGPEEGLELNKSTAILVQYSRETLTFEVGPIRIVEKDVKLKIPLPSNIQVYVGSSTQEAANGFIDQVFYQAHLSGDLGDRLEHRVKEFELPPAEQRLLERTRQTIQKNRMWARFDAFFGVFLIANSLLIGLEIEYNKDDSQVWVIVESVFIVIFTLELTLRIFMLRLKSFTQFLRDPWLVFDTLVVLQSMIETWFLPDIPGYLSILRLVRLLKLAKMVRLVRAFRELGILVEGVLNSFHTLFWTFVLLAISTYVGALLLVRTAQLSLEDYTAEDQARLSELLDVPQAMWRLLSMSTFDQWAAYVRGIAFGIRGVKGYVLSIELIVFLGFVGLGILNMVAGILCHTAFVLNQKYKHMKGVELLLVQQKAMRSLKNSLRTWGERPLFQNDRYIGMDEFFDVLSRNEQPGGDGGDHAEVAEMVDDPLAHQLTPAEAVNLLKLSGEELLSLCDTFAEDGQIEIDGLIEAIQIKELQAYYGLKSSNWITAKTMITLRPVDMVSFNFSLKSVEKHMSSIERSMNGVCSMAYDSLQHLHAQAKQADTLLRMDKAGWMPPAQSTADFKPALIDVKELENCVNRVQVSAEESRLYMPIDVVFGIFICANGLFVGVQLELRDTDEETKNIFYGIDVVFTVVFMVETLIRASLYTHLQGMNKAGPEDSVTDISRNKLAQLIQLRRRMLCRIFPPCPPGGCCRVCRYFPSMLAEAGAFCDFLLVLLSVVDSFVIANLRLLGVTTADPSILSVLRIFRLFRLAKALRVFRVFPYLQMFIFALFRVWKTVIWTLLLMLLFIYTYSLYAHVMLQPVPELQELFGSVPLCLLTGWRLTTFDNWAEVVNKTAEHAPESTVTLFMLAIVLGLGLMKMLIGVMSESAISLMQSREIDRQMEDLAIFIQEMANLTRLFAEEFDTTIIPQEFIENALDINIRPKRSDLTGFEGPKSSMVLPLHMFKEGLSKPFANRLLLIFKRANLSPDLVKQIYEKVDYQRAGYVDVHSFAFCAMVLKEDATKIQVFADITAIRKVRQLCSELEASLQSLHQQMETLLEDMCTLITRKRYSARGAEKSSSAQSSQLHTFGPDAMAALEELTSFSGTVPAVRSIGRLKVTNGHGQLKFDGDEATGVGTRLRSQLRPGDTLIVGVPISKEAKEQEMMAFSVVNHIGHERIKLSQKFPSIHVGKLFGFLVVKQGNEGQKYDWKHETNTDFMHNLHVQSELSPRSAQLLFEWELSTKRRHDLKFKVIQEDRVHLTKQMIELIRDLEALHSHDMATEVFNAWRELVKTLSSSRRNASSR